MQHLTKLDEHDLITVFLTTQLNADRLAAMPPILASEIEDPVERADARLSVGDTARGWDIYKDVIQLSFHAQAHDYHFMLCDTVGTQPVVKSETRTIRIFDTEEALMKGAFGLLSEMYGGEFPDGSPLNRCVLAGWRLHTQIWPALFNRAFRYRIQLPRLLQTDPERKWPTVTGLVDLLGIYTQGSGAARTIPGLADVLRYWGFGDATRHPLPADIAEAVCEDPINTAIRIEPYLVDMMNVVLTYYGVDTTPSRRGLAVPRQPLPIP